LAKIGKNIKATQKQEENKHEFSFGNIIQHVQEPLFILSILTLLVSIMFYSAVVGVSTETAALKSAISNSSFMAVGIFIFFALSCYFIYQYFSSGKKNSYFIGIAILILLTATYAYWASDALNRKDSAGNPNPTFNGARDYATWAIFFGMLAAAYMLWLHKLLDLSTGFLAAIVLTTALMHMMPAYTPSYNSYQGLYISDLDSNFHYREAKAITDTGHVADREKFVYPQLPVTFVNGTMQSVMYVSTYAFGWAVFMASVETTLSGYGFSLHDIAILAPGVMSVLVVFAFYLLLKELFSDMQPYNKAVALLGAFMLMMNPAFASRAIATDSENGTFGTFLLIALLWLLTIACKKKSINYAFLAGFTFLALELSWSGYNYALVVMGIFGIFYAIVSFMTKKSPLEHVPYFTITMLMALLAFLIQHTRGVAPTFSMPGLGYFWPIGGTLLTAFVLQAVMNLGEARKEETENKDRNLGEKIESILIKSAVPIAILMVLASFSYVFFVLSPDGLISYASGLIGSAQQQDIIEMTTAEQKATCDNIDFSCVNTLRQTLGMPIIYAIGMIAILFYYAFTRRSFGSVLVLSWSLPMMYGIIYKTQFLLVAGVPIVAMAATIGLVIPLFKKDVQTLRILPVLLILLLPFASSLASTQTVSGLVTNTIFGVYGGSQPMYGGLMGDRIYWDGTFKWLRTTPTNTIILTWWDYGHWIAGLTDRISILDNTKQEQYMVRDIARFHVIEENETSALEIAKKYNSTYVIIDYTMIGKSGAPHFIGSSQFGRGITLKIIGASTTCVNAVDCQNAVEGVDSYATTYVDKNGSVTLDMTSNYDINAVTIKTPGTGEKYGYYIEASADGTIWQKMVENTSNGGEQRNEFKTINARYIKVTGTQAPGNEFKFTVTEVYNPRKADLQQGYLGYGQCGFEPTASQIKPKPELNSNGGFDSTSTLIFSCNTGIALIFKIVDNKYSPDKVEVYYNGQRTSWKNWQEQTGASVLGVMSMQQILANALNYETQYADFPTFTTLVYVPKTAQYDYNKVMMTKLYLGDYLEEYQAAGLADKSIEKSKYFTLVDGFLGDKPQLDSSFYGYVRVYKINYPDNPENATFGT
jgi:asparagine N-glycosylation enzyme membrane subunit Stt3